MSSRIYAIAKHNKTNRLRTHFWCGGDKFFVLERIDNEKIQRFTDLELALKAAHILQHVYEDSIILVHYNKHGSSIWTPLEMGTEAIASVEQLLDI